MSPPMEANGNANDSVRAAIRTLADDCDALDAALLLSAACLSSPTGQRIAHRTGANMPSDSSPSSINNGTLHSTDANKTTEAAPSAIGKFQVHWTDVFRHGTLLERRGLRPAAARFLLALCVPAVDSTAVSAQWLTALLCRVSGRTDAIDFVSHFSAHSTPVFTPSDARFLSDPQSATLDGAGKDSTISNESDIKMSPTGKRPLRTSAHADTPHSKRTRSKSPKSKKTSSTITYLSVSKKTIHLLETDRDNGPLNGLAADLGSIHEMLLAGRSMDARDALRTLPPAAEALPYVQLLAAAACHAAGDASALFAHAQRLVAERPADTVALVAAGLHASLVGRIEDARRLYMRAVRLCGAVPAADAAHGAPIVAAEARSALAHDAALGAATRALAHIALGNCHAAVGDHDQALAAYVSALDHTARHCLSAENGGEIAAARPCTLAAAEARACIAAEHVRVGRPLLARTYVDGTTDACQSDTLLLNERGAALYAAGEYEAALAVFAAACASLDNAARHTPLGRALVANMCVARLRLAVARRDHTDLAGLAARWREHAADPRLAALLAEIDGVVGGSHASLAGAVDCLRVSGARQVSMRAASLAHRALRRVLSRMHPLPADHPLAL